LEERRAKLDHDILMLDSQQDELLEQGTESLQTESESADSQLMNQKLEQEIAISQSKRDELADQVTEFQEKLLQLESEFAKRRGALRSIEDHHHRVLEQLDQRKTELEQDIFILQAKRDDLLEGSSDDPSQGGRESPDSQDVPWILALEHEISIGTQHETDSTAGLNRPRQSESSRRR
jgi:predicted  nucleic acid-binding Zn-ribbon protein